MKALSVAGMVCVLAATCASVTPSRASLIAVASLQQSPSASVPDDSIPWSRYGPLDWNDFKGRAPVGGVEGARTVYALTYESQCRGNKFTFLVTAVFFPHQSWVKRSVVIDPSESARVLRHERTHFNVTEVYARRMRKYFAELYNPCGQTDDQVRAAVDRFVADEAALQKRYDDESGYGLEAPRQRVWDRDVEEQLRTLEKFAQP